MKVIATNIGKPTTIIWNGKKEQTGIYKYPTSTPLYLGKDDVKEDSVIERRHHGGEYKACYLYSADQYPYWKKLYKDLSWDWGMFGENLTIAGLDESEIRIGNIYKIGTATVQISLPREPCYKLGIRFGNQNILKQFIDFGHSGTYVKVLEEGIVKEGDTMELIEQSTSSLTVQELYHQFFTRNKNIEILKMAIENKALPIRKREKLKKYLI